MAAVGWVPTNNELLDQFDPLTDAQLALVAEVEAAIRSVALPPTFVWNMKRWPTLFLAKFLMARQWKVDDAVAMFKASADFRIRNDLDETPQFPTTLSVRGFDVEKLIAFHGVGRRDVNGQTDFYGKHVHTCVENGWHKWDKRGRPVIFERIGKIKPGELVGRCRALVAPHQSYSDCSLDLHLHSNEVGNVITRYLNSTYPPERHVAQVIAVFDCTDLGMRHLWDPLIQLMKRNSNTDKLYFPEGLHKAYIVNAPTIITAFWAVVKLWLEPNQIKKVIFLKPHETPAGLKEAIDDEHLPSFLGGSCECPGGCLAPAADLDSMPLPPDGTREESVGARSKKLITGDWLRVTEAGRKIGYQAVSEGYTCGFRVRFLPDGASDAAAPWRDIGQALFSEGVLEATGPGVIQLELDNSFSRLRGKKVFYRFYFPNDSSHRCGGVENPEFREQTNHAAAAQGDDQE
jgi:hypothetical protein